MTEMGVVAATEAERDEIADRDRTRRIVQGAAEKLLTVVLNTPSDWPLNMYLLFDQFQLDVLPALREHRAHQKRRATKKAAV